MFNNISAIYKKELRSYFASPVAYIAIAMFLVIAGYFFFPVFAFYKESTLEYSLSNLVIVLIFLMPLLSMRLLSEEKKSGTLELLLTRPVRDFEIVIGKYLSCATVLLVMMLPTLTYGLILFRYGKPDLYPMILQYGAIFLVGLSFLALGLFASSLTENQIVAAIIGFTITLLLWLLTWMTQQLGPDNIISYFAISSHFEDLNRGVIDAKDVVFYISFIAFWLYMTTRTLDVRRWL
ncbi:MAG: ABC transporter permease [bacterium]|nr:ABC transporter permease [bacterium]